MARVPARRWQSEANKVRWTEMEAGMKYIGKTYSAGQKPQGLGGKLRSIKMV